MASNASAVEPSDSCLAWLTHDGQTHWSRGDGTGPFSSVVRLILGIQVESPRHARKILRNRIFHTRPLGPFAYGMLKVGAKRATDVNAAAAPEGGFEVCPELDWPTLECREWIGKTLADETDARAAAVALERKVLNLRASVHQARAFALDRPVGAILLSAEGEVLGAATNASSRSTLLHAEFLCLLGYFARTGKALPYGARLYVTLKPCRMCAGLFLELGGSRKGVWYRDFDPGPMGRSTILDEGSADARLFPNHPILEPGSPSIP